MKVLFLVSLAFVSLMSCGNGKEVYHTVLDGYKDGKLRIKYDDLMVETKLDDGTEGYLLTTKVEYSDGSNRKATTTKTWMRQDFALVRKETTIFKNDEQTDVDVTWIEGKSVRFTHKGEGRDLEETVPWDKETPAIGEIHPLLFTKDLTAPGTQKSYWIFYEPMRGIAPIRVKRGDNTTITLAGKAYECARYGVRSMTGAGHYDDFYIDLATNRVMKIIIANTEFVPPGTHD